MVFQGPDNPIYVERLRTCVNVDHVLPIANFDLLIMTLPQKFA